MRFVDQRLRICGGMHTWPVAGTELSGRAQSSAIKGPEAIDDIERVRQSGSLNLGVINVEGY